MLPPVDFPGVQGRGGGGRVGDVDPLDAIDLGDLAAGTPGRGFLTWHVVGVLDIDHLAAGNPLFLDELEGARASGIRDRRECIGLGDALGHDEGHVRRRLGERLQREREGFLELELESLVVDRSPGFGHFAELLAEHVALGPALDRGDAIGWSHRGAVMELQAVAQRERVGELVRAQFPLVDHLRLDLEIRIGREQDVIHHVAVVAGDVGRCPDRIEDPQIRLRDELDGLPLRHGSPARDRTERKDEPDRDIARQATGVRCNFLQHVAIPSGQ